MKRAAQLADAWCERAAEDVGVATKIHQDLFVLERAMELASQAEIGDWHMIKARAGHKTPASDTTALLTVFALHQRGVGAGM